MAIVPPLAGRVAARIVAGGLVLAVLLGVGAQSALAEAPPGPRLAYLRWDLYGGPEQLQLDSAAPDGSAVQLLAGGAPSTVPLPDVFGGVSWSPDGDSLAFAGGQPPGAPYELGFIYIVPAAGGVASQVPGSEGASRPVFAPDARSLAVVRTRRARFPHPGQGRVDFETSVWLLGIEGGFTRQLTGWNSRGGVPSSFTPDGRTLGITRYGPHHRDDAVAISLGRGKFRLIAAGAATPVYSPNGSRVAVVRPTLLSTAIYVGRSDGSHLRRLSDGREEYSPAWDPSGQRLAFVRYDSDGYPQSLLGLGDTLVEINADGSCETRISTAPADAVFAPAWQPGPGRQAGRIACSATRGP